MIEFNPSEYFKTTLRIGLADIDTAGFVYHGNYYHLYNIARDEFFREIGYPYSRLMAEGMHLGVAHIDCNYLKPLEYDDLIEIETGVVWLKDRAVGIQQKIVRGKERLVCNQVSFTFVCIDAAMKAVAIPKALCAAIKDWADE
jgi:acyl-CoA thioester hydrolase